MSDIRINALATTATTSASDDYFAIDGSANGTRKLSAYSPTFGGNLTASGTVTIASNFIIASTGFYAGGGTPGAGRFLYSATAGSMLCGQTGSTYDLSLASASGTTILGVPTGTNNILIPGGNLTVSGTGTSSFAGPLIIGAATSAVNTAWTGSGYSGFIAFPDSSEFAVYSEPNGAYRGGGMISNIARVGSGWSFVNSAFPAWRVGVGHGLSQDYFAINRSPATTYSEVTLLRLTNTGNLLIGTTTDGGQKLQVNGTGYFAGALLQLGDGTADAVYRVSASNGKSTDLGDDTTGGFLRANNSQSLRVITGGTTALTLDSSQRCILAGALRLNNAYTAGAPTATGYVTLQDSAGNTYKVLVGT